MDTQPEELKDVALGRQEQQCRYCLGSTLDAGDEFVSPCACSGGQKWVHLQCLRRWQRSILVTQPTHPLLQKDDARTTHCGVCTEKFRYPPPSRHEMLMSFTGAELAALVQETSLICASETFSVELRAGLHSSTNRRSITNFVHWCKAVYFIYYAGPKRLVLNVPDEENRFALLEALSSTGVLTLRGRQYHVLEEGPLENLSFARMESSTPMACPSAASRSRGAEWVETAVKIGKPGAGNLNVESNPVREAIANLPIPAELTVQVADGDERDATDDSIRALNLGNRISQQDLSDEVLTIVQRAIRDSTIPQNLLAAVDVQHYLGGPCSPTQCVVVAPMGSDDGIIPPLPHGFKALPSLGVVIGTDLAVALRRVAMVREPRMPEQALKRRKVSRARAAETCAPLQTQVADNDLQNEEKEDCAEEGSEELRFAEEEVSSAGSEVNAGEFIASPPSTPSDEDDIASDQIGRTSTDSVDMLVAIAAESLGAEIAASAPPAGETTISGGRQSSLRPILVFWGEARWQRTQLLGELAKGDWGLCQAMSQDLRGDQGLWQRIAVEEHRSILAPRSEMSRELSTDASVAPRTLRRIAAAHQEALRQQGTDP